MSKSKKRKTKRRNLRPQYSRSMKRKSMKSKSMKRKSMKRKSMKRKSMKRKSMKRKSMKSKSMKRKSMKRKSMKRKSMKRKIFFGGAQGEIHIHNLRKDGHLVDAKIVGSKLITGRNNKEVELNGKDISKVDQITIKGPSKGFWRGHEMYEFRDRVERDTAFQSMIDAGAREDPINELEPFNFNSFLLPIAGKLATLKFQGDESDNPSLPFISSLELDGIVYDETYLESEGRVTINIPMRFPPDNAVTPENIEILSSQSFRDYTIKKNVGTWDLQSDGVSLSIADKLWAYSFDKVLYYKNKVWATSTDRRAITFTINFTINGQPIFYYEIYLDESGGIYRVGEDGNNEYLVDPEE